MFIVHWSQAHHSCSHTHLVTRLLRKPWLSNAKVAHDWGNNIMTIQRNGTIRAVVVTKHLGIDVKQPKVLLCNNYQNGITDEEEKSNHKGTKVQNHFADMNNTNLF